MVPDKPADLITLQEIPTWATLLLHSHAGLLERSASREPPRLQDRTEKGPREADVILAQHCAHAMGYCR